MATKEKIENAIALLSERTGIKKFGLLGSLAAIGSSKPVPMEMLHSPDMDLCTPDDEDRIFELADTYRKNGEFHNETGLYADPLSIGVAALPDGWQRRSKLYKIGNGVVLQIPNINDIAVSKLLRFAENDKSWLTAGLKSQLIDAEALYSRLTLTDEDFESIQQARHNLVELLDENIMRPPIDVFDYSSGEILISNDNSLSFEIKWNNGYHVDVIHFDSEETPVIAHLVFPKYTELEEYLDKAINMTYTDFVITAPIEANKRITKTPKP